MKTSGLFRLAIDDLRTPGMLALVTMPFLISLVALIVLYGGLVVWLFEALGSDLASTYLPEWILAIGDWPLIGSPLKTILGYLLGLLLSVIGYFIISELFVITGVLIAGFFTGRIALMIHARHYNTLPRPGNQPLLPVIAGMGVRILGYGILLVVTLPLLLIPGIGILIVNLVLFGLFRSLLLLDVGTTILDPVAYQTLVRRPGGAWSSTGLLYLASLVPLLNLAVPVFGVIVTSHLVFQRLDASEAQTATTATE